MPWLSLAVGVALVGVIAINLPAALRTDPVPTPSATPDAALTAVASPSAEPHGDDVDRLVDPPIDRAAGPTPAPASPAQLSGYRWPIRNARITNVYGKGHPGGFLVDGVTAHDGIDLSTFCGDRIVAAHDGLVLAAGRHHEGYVGWLGDLTAFREKLDAENAWRTRAIAVVIDDGNGYRSLYIHLAKANVAPGDIVRAGDLIGWEGETGNATGCHLHYGLFSPDATDSWLLDPEVAARNLLPDREIARIDPLLVLPPLADAGITWGWGVAPTE
jgi:murein DD-endopeptidase MepM/ murein hydrolase activator NlpD